MDEVFFNPGNAITSDVDPKEVIRTAQITTDQRRETKDRLVMVKDENGEHFLFEVNDQNQDQNGHKYQVEQKF